MYQNEEEVGAGIRAMIDQGVVKREDLFIVSKVQYTAKDNEPNFTQFCSKAVFPVWLFSACAQIVCQKFREHRRDPTLCLETNVTPVMHHMYFSTYNEHHIFVALGDSVSFDLPILQFHRQSTSNPHLQLIGPT